MPGRHRLRPLKAWRYVGVFGPELMLCVAMARIGPARQSFWAIWDRRNGTLLGRTTPGAGGVSLAPGRAGARVQVLTASVAVDLTLEETAGIETVCPSAAAYAWTRKQGGVRALGTVAIEGRDTLELDARAVIDDTAGYYQRHTRWWWSAGVGTAVDGRAVAWNLVRGVNDPPQASERTVWVEGLAAEAPPVSFAVDLSRVGDLRFHAEASREHHQNLLFVRSRYRQPFGTFSGTLPGGIELAAGYGVMEDHEVWW